jgi:hypothetical protein
MRTWGSVTAWFSAHSLESGAVVIVEDGRHVEPATPDEFKANVRPGLSE